MFVFTFKRANSQFCAWHRGEIVQLSASSRTRHYVRFPARQYTVYERFYSFIFSCTRIVLSLWWKYEKNMILAKKWHNLGNDSFARVFPVMPTFDHRRIQHFRCGGVHPSYRWFYFQLCIAKGSLESWQFWGTGLSPFPDFFLSFFCLKSDNGVFWRIMRVIAGSKTRGLNKFAWYSSP